MEDFEIKNDTQIIKKLHLENSKFLLYVGRIHEKKGIELLIDSFNKISKDFKDIVLVIAGTGNKEYVKKLKDIIKLLGLSQKIIFVGFVSHDEKLELLKNAKMFILTSYSDIHPRAIQEALTMGLPVICTRVCDYPEIDEYEAGINVELDVNSIYSAIKNLLENQKTLDLFSKNAKKLINEKFLLVDQVKKFEEIYQKSLKTGKKI